MAAHKWLVYEQIMRDNIIKHSCTNIEYVLIRVVMITDTYSWAHIHYTVAMRATPILISDVKK